MTLQESQSDNSQLNNSQSHEGQSRGVQSSNLQTADVQKNTLSASHSLENTSPQDEIFYDDAFRDRLGAPHKSRSISPLSVRRSATLVDTPAPDQLPSRIPWIVWMSRNIVTGIFDQWVTISTALARAMLWRPRVNPYIGYGTEQYARIICRTTFAPRMARPESPIVQGFRSFFMVPAAYVPVSIRIDDIPVGNFAYKNPQYNKAHHTDRYTNSLYNRTRYSDTQSTITDNNSDDLISSSPSSAQKTPSSSRIVSRSEVFTSLLAGIEEMKSNKKIRSLITQRKSGILTNDKGYLDIVTQGNISAGLHTVEYWVAHRPVVKAPLYIVSEKTQVGIISDIDDTILVSNIPDPIIATRNFLFTNPAKRRAVAAMAHFYQEIQNFYQGNVAFFYLSAAPWNVEPTLRRFIQVNNFPQGPLLLRDLDPRPKTFVPSSIEHKLEFCDQLMADFPNMKFILIGDNGQMDPQIYARVSKKYPDRVLAIGIRLLRFKDHLRFARGAFHSMPPVDVPVFFGENGTNLARTMLPYLRGTVSQTFAGSSTTSSTESSMRTTRQPMSAPSTNSTTNTSMKFSAVKSGEIKSSARQKRKIRKG